MIKKIIYTLLIVCFLPSLAFATQAPIKKYASNLEIVGQGRLTYMIWDVYDATLYAPNGSYQKGKPFVLSLDYLRKIKGEDIVERSIKEMRKQGYTNEKKLNQWAKKMAEIFPDVDKGVSLTGIRHENGYTFFYKNGTRIGVIKDKEFSEKFFDIWLNEKTSDPKLRKKLLGS